MSFQEYLNYYDRCGQRYNREVLNAIYTFSHAFEDDNECEVVYNLFAAGYCYYFACILQCIVGAGDLVVAPEYGHILYALNDVLYDIHGISEEITMSDVRDATEDALQGYLHIRGTVDEFIVDMIQPPVDQGFGVSYYETCKKLFMLDKNKYFAWILSFAYGRGRVVFEHGLWWFKDVDGVMYGPEGGVPAGLHIR